MSRPEDTELAFDDEPGEDLPDDERDRFPPIRWWNGLEAIEQGLYGGLALVGIGLAMAGYVPAALVVSGATFALLSVYATLVTIHRGGGE